MMGCNSCSGVMGWLRRGGEGGGGRTLRGGGGGEGEGGQRLT
jgi:hypothetical protein